MAKFKTGRLLFTRAVNDLIADDINFAAFVIKCQKRFMKCDWGDCCPEDKEANDKAVKDGSRIIGVYKNDKWKVWIITEADRSYTTIMFPEDY